ncbi:ABC transporter ATP-binding protein [Streptomyces sp. NRRL F-5135]|uniref:ABC transporter ATP-binding protein n=1 Tax=Streptomyces sp. NRRL F-5135 TaxID=1463858 RepID=UPI000B2C822C|nr:ABC transporter ATP-binding protein [Streptomyces sp. NRRL F-5135]
MHSVFPGESLPDGGSGSGPAPGRTGPAPAAEAAGTPVVEVRGLVKRYGAKTAVDGLDLVVRAGTVTAVLGPNGAGKTTTVETCEGYRRPDAGTVRVLGLDPVADAARLRPRIGVMLQSGGVYSGARAGEMLRHMARLHAHPLDVDALIERLGLGDCGRTTYRRLSGGQQQRLALAMAVVGRPELVFLDEPTAGLDPQARRATWELVRQLRTDGVGVVLTTHFMDEAEELADDVVIIDAGRVIAQDSPERLCRGGAENTLRFTGRPALDLGSLLKALPDGSEAAELPGAVYRVTGTVGPQLLATVASWCAQHGVMPDTISVERRTLEDVFLELTGKELRS